MLRENVLSELKSNGRVSSADVGIAVEDGVVTLTGVVNSRCERAAAEHAAHGVRGVHDVANDLQVRVPAAPGRTDTEIAHAVRRALFWNVLVPDDTVHSTVSNGVVVLQGQLRSTAQKREAERVVEELAGVRSVRNEIEIPPRPVKAPAVRFAIEQALERQAARQAHRIRVEIENGVATLSGEVRTDSERRAAVGAARGAPGVRRVEGRLRRIRSVGHALPAPQSDFDPALEGAPI